MSTSPTSSLGGSPPDPSLYTIFIPSYVSPSPPAGAISIPERPHTAVTFLQEQGQEKSNRGARKGHKKSRGACFTCKRQKIKCKENRPSCDYCANRGIKCEWPTITKPRGRKAISKNVAPPKPQQSYAGLEPILSIQPRSIQTHDMPPVFSMEDMRLYNHFIQRAYPQHPRGNDSIWTHEIPALASKYDYLIHAMLALSASELSVTDNNPRGCPQKLRNTSLYHRSKSITALNSAIQRGVNSVEEGNAMLASIFSLLFQSTFIGDGLVEYMTFIRGAIVVGGQMVKQHLKIVFSNMNVAQPPGKPKEDEGMIKDAPIIQREVVFGAMQSLDICAELCGTKLERRVLHSLMEIARSLAISSTHAYLKLREMYGLFAMQMTPAEFHIFTSTTSSSAQTFKILQAHFVALQLIMNPVASKEAMPRTEASPTATCPVKEIGRAATAGWLVSLHRDIDGDLLRKYCVWTRWIEEEILGGRLLDGSRARSLCVFEGGNGSGICERDVLEEFNGGGNRARYLGEGVGLSSGQVLVYST